MFGDDIKKNTFSQEKTASIKASFNFGYLFVSTILSHHKWLIFVWKNLQYNSFMGAIFIALFGTGEYHIFQEN